MQQEQKKPMRDVMPVCAEFVDALREAGLFDNATFARALKEGSCSFREAEQLIGSADISARVDAMVEKSCAARVRAEEEWQKEVSESPRLAHAYNMTAFRRMQEKAQ